MFLVLFYFTISVVMTLFWYTGKNKSALRFKAIRPVLFRRLKEYISCADKKTDGNKKDSGILLLKSFLWGSYISSLILSTSSRESPVILEVISVVRPSLSMDTAVLCFVCWIPSYNQKLWIAWGGIKKKRFESDIMFLPQNNKPKETSYE